MFTCWVLRWCLRDGVIRWTLHWWLGRGGVTDWALCWCFRGERVFCRVLCCSSWGFLRGFLLLLLSLQQFSFAVHLIWVTLLW